MSHLCCIFNLGPHYRFPIYAQIAATFDAHFFLGDEGNASMKVFRYEDLPGFKGRMSHISFGGKWYWQSNMLRLAFKNYSRFIITGEPYCVTTWFFLIMSKLLGKRSIAWTHGWYGREYGIKKVIKKAYFKLFDDIMCYNDYGNRQLIEQGFNASHIFTIANSLDSEKQRIIRNQLKSTDIFYKHFGNNAPVIIYCGRIQKVKKIDMLVKALSVLRQREVFVNLLLVGKDVDNVNLPATISALGLDKQVWIYGPCFDELKLAEFFYNSSVCVSPGNVGLTCIHSLTYGCPVITHDDFPTQMPEFEAIVPGKTGDFYRNGDIQDLVDKIQCWVLKSVEEREQIRSFAFYEIDHKWSVDCQIGVLKRILS